MSREKFRSFLTNLKSSFEEKRAFEIPANFNSDLKALSDEAEKSAKIAIESAQKLQLTELEKKVASAITKLNTVNSQVTDFEKCNHLKQAYETQIITLSTMLAEFIKVQNNVQLMELNFHHPSNFYHSTLPMMCTHQQLYHDTVETYSIDP